MASTNRFVAEHKDEYRTSAVVVGTLIPNPIFFSIRKEQHVVVINGVYFYERRQKL